MKSEPLVLIVEDDDLTRRQLKNHFDKEDYLVRSAIDAEQASEILKHQDVDLIILDIIMPGMDGFEFLERVRSDYSELELPVIMSTVRDRTEDIVQALKEGANDYVTKPVDFEVVKARIETHLKIQELKAENRRLARHDSLTGLLDRRILLEELDARLDKYRTRPVVLALMDLDHFKSVNDQHGHLVGDEVLRKVGDLLNDTFRNCGLAGRYGGEEFGIILDNIHRDEARQRLNSLREKIKDIELEDVSDLHCSGSIGATTLTEREERKKEELLQQADQALYTAKEGGRDAVKFFDEVGDE